MHKSGSLDNGMDNLMAGMREEMEEMATSSSWGGGGDAHDNDELNDAYR